MCHPDDPTCVGGRSRERARLFGDGAFHRQSLDALPGAEEAGDAV
jgi:hypothetical protein